MNRVCLDNMQTNEHLSANINLGLQTNPCFSSVVQRMPIHPWVWACLHEIVGDALTTPAPATCIAGDVVPAPIIIGDDAPPGCALNCALLLQASSPDMCKSNAACAGVCVVGAADATIGGGAAAGVGKRPIDWLSDSKRAYSASMSSSSSSKSSFPPAGATTSKLIL